MYHHDRVSQPACWRYRERGLRIKDAQDMVAHKGCLDSGMIQKTVLTRGSSIINLSILLNDMYWCQVKMFGTYGCYRWWFNYGQVMACCLTAPSHYLIQCRLRAAPYGATRPQQVNTLRPRQNGRHFADDIFKWIFLNENVRISIKISLKFVPKGQINNIPALVQIMAWHRSGDKPLSEPMMVSLLTHICVTRPQWVNKLTKLLIEMFGYRLALSHDLLLVLDISSPSVVPTSNLVINIPANANEERNATSQLNAK